MPPHSSHLLKPLDVSLLFILSIHIVREFRGVRTRSSDVPEGCYAKSHANPVNCLPTLYWRRIEAYMLVQFLLFLLELFHHWSLIVHWIPQTRLPIVETSSC